MLIIDEPSIARLLQEGEMRLQEQFAFGGTYSTGAISLAWGILDIVAVWGLWKSRKWGGYLAAGLSSLVIIVAIISWNLLSIVDITFGAFVLILLASGWKSLTPSQTPANEPSSNSPTDNID